MQFWICSSAKKVKLIRFRCVLCRKLDKLFASQRIAPIPKERLRPCLLWQCTNVDLFGSYTIKDEVKKRCKGKAYGLIFNCCVSRAVYIDIAADYSTDGFLMPFRRFVSLQDYPDKVISDCGTQLMAASKELKDIKGLKQEQMNMMLRWE